MSENTCLEKQPLCQEMLDKMNAYWRAANYLSAGQLYLLDNPLLKEPLTMDQIKKKIVGHWGTELCLCTLQPCDQALRSGYDLTFRSGTWWKLHDCKYLS